MIKGSCKFMGGISLRYVTTVTGLVNKDIVTVEIKRYMSKELCVFMRGNS